MRLGPGPAPPEQQLAGGNVGIGFLDVVSGTHLSTLATRAREAMEQTPASQTTAGDMQAVHIRHRPFGVR